MDQKQYIDDNILNNSEDTAMSGIARVFSVPRTGRCEYGSEVSPWGVHMDLALLSDISNPEKEVGVALETGFYF